MNDLRDLKDLTKHDVRPISDEQTSRLKLGGTAICLKLRLTAVLCRYATFNPEIEKPPKMADPEIGSTSMAGSGGIRESKCCPKSTLGSLEQNRLFGRQRAHATRLETGFRP